MSQPARSTSVRRPLPALAFLLGLALLTALVWWRVIHRSDGSTAKTTASRTCSTAIAAKPTVLPASADVSFDVLNSTTKTGLAGTTSTALVQLGFKQAAQPTNDLTTRAPVAGIAELRFGPGGKAGADLLSYYVPGAIEVPDTRAGSVVDVAVGAKFTAVATQAAVAAALKAAHVTQATAGASIPAAVQSSC
jgi:LytR cell envelope-related transcriptional attenuator